MLTPKVFISYAREDVETAERIYDDIRKTGVVVWFDKHSLLPGRKWKSEIEKAIRNCTYFLALLSSRSVSKRGYVQKELKEALDLLDEFPESGIFLIPIRLDECNPSHEKLNELHRVDLFPSYDEGLKNILRVIEPQEVDWPLSDPVLISTDFASQPTIDIEFSSSKASETVRVKAVLDTAAVKSCIPTTAAKLLGPLRYSTAMVRGTGGTQRAFLYVVNLRIADKVFRDVAMIGVDLDYALVGLDILSQAIVLFDGPHRTIKIWIGS